MTTAIETATKTKIASSSQNGRLLLGLAELAADEGGLTSYRVSEVSPASP